ncbi:hypothetical protein [Vibrio crassostreae]|uniref:hypothetical protein n=1 Tax=Vibrio crassostreae TaxID=246167 RepID=UPI000F4A36C6|nr:hypothetical protein [Vibrio crassostreae]ROP11139.1 hypothetical protein EDB33_11938 [Vibrio crassostreae]ROP15446.1 hypothetical protein EDB34_11938 [Vibrio crassostreae]RPE89158.1 hypothetical protein EDB15_11938 [Vibrio crassostreae]RPF12246.1 LOW QUALITY PROTEIN: hypothetical protein EDB14_0209 [Vibrio crassostreae]TCN63145.1 hypothetical protein EDB60_11838 [Vibrio crassostreae]
MTFTPAKHLPAAFIAFVFIQSLFFKFTGSYETEHIFGTLATWSDLSWFGSFGGYLIGFAELIAAILLFTRWHGLGAIMSVGIMSGAIFFHLFTPLGIQMPEFNAAGEIVGDDGGLLFGMACLVWLCGAFLSVKDFKNQDGFLNNFSQ